MYTIKQIGDLWAILGSTGIVLKTFATEDDAKYFLDYVSN